jgi:hypothetical protein
MFIGPVNFAAGLKLFNGIFVDDKKELYGNLSSKERIYHSIFL